MLKKLPGFVEKGGGNLSVEVGTGWTNLIESAGVEEMEPS
tara:strand:+ start:2442 stop:2561 length:120 start_codon:yes stop_codon:yes gene_type:complete